MREFGTIHRGFWANEDLRQAGDDARLLGAYLLTSPHTTALGAFRLPDAYVCDDLEWEKKRFRNSLQALSDAGFVKYDPDTKWVWVVKFLEWNRPANPNIWKAIAKAASNVPDAVSFRDEILVSAGVSETVSETVRKPSIKSPSPSPSLGEVGENSITIPASDGSEYAIPLADIAEWEHTYPAVNVEGELQKARAWCLANPSKRKTHRGMSKFLNGWLSRANDRPGSSVNGAPPPARKRQLL